jgi:hypothetical protein
MELAVVLVLGPRLGSLVELSKAQIVHLLEHSHQSAFDGGPKDLDLRIGGWRIGKSCLLQDAEPCQTFNNFRRGLSRAVIAKARAREPALLEGLGKAMHNDLCGLAQIPLQMTSKARTVIDHAE